MGETGTEDTERIIAGENLGTGVSVAEGNAIVLMWIDYQGQHIGMALSPLSARQLSETLVVMAGQAESLEEHVTVATTPAELADLLETVQQEISEEAARMSAEAAEADPGQPED